MRTLFVATTMFVALSSFALMGADSFAILLDGKLITEQYVARNEVTIPKIEIGSTNKELVVKYSECGRTVSGRKITAKDNNDVVIKEWKFDGTTSGFKDPMKLDVKELISLKQRSNGAIRLFYSSIDFPQGQNIANIVISPTLAKTK